MIDSIKVKYEYRTSKATAAIFDSLELAQVWQKKLAPGYAQSLKLFRVITHVIVEEV